jgi:hypothetical protein
VSDRVRPEAALRELELLVRSLGEELAGFRRRALDAERKLRDLSAQPHVAPATATDARCAELERENEALRQRLVEASTRTRQMVERVRFLRQQQEQDGDR